MPSHYETLGLDPSASEAEIKKAFKKKASKHHPDQGGDTAKMTAVTVAYRVLKNPEIRSHYDKTGQSSLPDKEREAQELLLLLFNQFLDQNFPISLNDFVEQNLRQGRQKFQQQITTCRETIKRISKQRKKVKYKGKGTNLFLNLLEQKESLAKITIAAAEAEIEKAKRVEEMLKEYEDETEKETVYTSPFDSHTFFISK